MIVASSWSLACCGCRSYCSAWLRGRCSSQKCESKCRSSSVPSISRNTVSRVDQSTINKNSLKNLLQAASVSGLWQAGILRTNARDQSSDCSTVSALRPLRQQPRQRTKVALAGPTTSTSPASPALPPRAENGRDTRYTALPTMVVASRTGRRSTASVVMASADGLSSIALAWPREEKASRQAATVAIRAREILRVIVILSCYYSVNYESYCPNFKRFFDIRLATLAVG